MPRPPSFIADPPAHLRGGPPGGAHPNADLGRAHVLARYFGVETDPRKSDQRLVTSLDEKKDYLPLESYRASAETRALGAMRVEVKSGVAVVHPGLGEVAIPAGARAIAIDVGDLPETDDARAAIERILPVVLHGDVALPEVQHRRCNGHPDEVFSLQPDRKIDQYRCNSEISRRTIHGTGRALPLAVITSSKLTPLAAWTAAMLRGASDALVVGAAVPTRLAESRWVGIGDSGLAIRVAHYSGLPDILAADAPDLGAVQWAAPRRHAAEASTRKPIANLERVTQAVAPSNSEGDRRAALLVAYAATRTFFPYFEETGDGLDARLDEALAMLGPGRASVTDALGHFAQVLHDSHVWIANRGGGDSGVRAVLPFVSVGNDFVVAASRVDAIKPGEVLVALDGEPVAARVAKIEPLVSGSPQAIRVRIAARLGAHEYTLRTPKGTTHTVQVPPTAELPAPKPPHVDVPGIVYVDTSKVTNENVPGILKQIAEARGVIIDNRGYPAIPAMRVLAFMLPPEARGPEMAEVDVTPFGAKRGPWQKRQVLANWPTEPQGYHGPVVMLAGAGTQSRAEHFMTFFRSVKRGLVIGGPTSGANGTITGVQLPGGYTMSFTGMFVRQPDGSRFHAVGHPPEFFVEPSVDDLANGRDTVLLRALAELTKR